MIHTDKGIDDGSSKQPSQQDVPGLAEIVRHLENRLALMRQEATSLDQLLRSELEVQRRQQNIMTTTLQSLQERLQEVEARFGSMNMQYIQEHLQEVEARSEAMRIQLEDTLREVLA